ncbi:MULTISPECIES: 4Fe-4S binding protein [Campylobacter]|uniref:4Fe-4S binding protein n=1 Tax=Campylobacter californiensis TaxID=1032243 RepID=A0ABD4JHD2_9BACT|nr:4Fe-4S binding protein [Campylobacter sp. RM12916]MBE2985974.1 4Fe-4S binding protein [Campylobacter sp. RM12919]MBE2988346.1 4Fe-4S binding protein [Campylobacter sp. RM12920]MBE3021365.1 4Fe-4S binding protein [Campylobacter sp. 7477a]MBE3609247.1 4Fe-4S binding protein [Campylobacter sp. RM12916]
MIIRDDVPVWVDESRCKACDICVSNCPAGVLGMRIEISAVLGKIIEVVHPESCIGCRDCELHCPDFAIYVADKGYKFAKLTPESKERALLVKENKFQKLEA